jgi:hypothetical protein
MYASRCVLLGFLACLAVSLMLGIPAATQEPPPRTPTLGPQWRKDYAALLARPVAMQQRIRQLDRQLREEDLATQARLLKVMQRYCDWLEELASEDQRYVESAASVAEKLERIRTIRQKQWIASLPKADRERLDAAQSPEERQQLLAALQDREQQMDLEWHVTLAQLGNWQEKVRQELTRWRKELQPKLRPAERQRLREAQMEARPVQIKLLIELSQKYAVPIPPLFQKFRLSQAALPPVADRRLLHFLRTQVAGPERKQYEARLRDPEQQDQALVDLVELYWKKHPDELQRSRDAEQKRRKN